MVFGPLQVFAFGFEDTSGFEGRIAEELIFGADKVTTGASNDIQRATEIARSMVTKWGLSGRLGPLAYGEDEQEVFLGHSVTQHKNVSDDTAHTIDEEIRAFIDRNYQRSKELLNEHVEQLKMMAEALLKYETIDADQIKDIMAGKTPRPPRDWDDTEPKSGNKVDSEEGADEGAKEDKSKSGIGGPVRQH